MKEKKTTYICPKFRQMDKSKDTELRILNAATQVFLEKGYSNTNMSLIAEEAHINRSALYYYYRTKDKIFGAVVGSIVRDFFPSVIGILRSDVPLSNRIDALTEAYFSQMLSHPGLPLFIVREVNRDADFMYQIAQEEKITDYVLVLKCILEDEIREGHIKPQPPQVVLMTFLSQVMVPFLARPIAETVFNPDFEGFVRSWQPYVANSLKHLLLP